MQVGNRSAMQIGLFLEVGVVAGKSALVKHQLKTMSSRGISQHQANPAIRPTSNLSQLRISGSKSNNMVLRLADAWISRCRRDCILDADTAFAYPVTLRAKCMPLSWIGGECPSFDRVYDDMDR